MITGGGVSSVIDQSNQTNIAVITDKRIASNFNSRIVQNKDIRLDCRVFGLTTVQADSSDAIGIGTRSLRQNADGIQVLTRDLKTVDIPNVMISIISLSNQHGLSA